MRLDGEIVHRGFAFTALSPASVQPSPAAVTARAGRRARRRQAGPCRPAPAARPGLAAHAHHQASAVVHPQQHLRPLPGSAGVLDRHPSTGGPVGHPPRAAALVPEHGHAHAGFLLAAPPHAGVQRHGFIIHIHNALPPARPRFAPRRKLAVAGLLLPMPPARGAFPAALRAITMPLESASPRLNSLFGCDKMGITREVLTWASGCARR